MQSEKNQVNELEDVVLGAILLESSAIITAMNILPSYKAFTSQFNQDLYSACLMLFENSEPIDIITATQKMLEKFPNHEKAAFQVSQKTSRVNSSANLDYHCRIIAQTYLKRELGSTCWTAWQASQQEQADVFDLLDDTSSQLAQLSGKIFDADGKDITRITDDVMKDMIKARDNEGEITGLGTGFQDLDRMTHGLQKSDLIYLAARPSMGKTALFLSWIINQIEAGAVPVVFSLEMSSEQLTQRLISQMSQIPLRQIRTGRINAHEEQQIREAVGKLNMSKIKIVDRAFNIMQIKSHLSQHVRQNDLDVIYVDYLQLMEGGDKRSNREQQVSQISRSLKMTAKDFDVPVVCLSQLSRAVEQRGGAKKPMLSDLRESGSIEQDADQVLFLYRPSYYGFEEDADGNFIPDGYTELICQKNRNGQLFTSELMFFQECTLFTDFDRQPQGFEPF